jgi:hypothetical protein
VYICNYCGDYTFRDGECSICGHPLRRATAEEECTACQNPHRSDFEHTCKATTEELQKCLN